MFVCACVSVCVCIKSKCDPGTWAGGEISPNNGRGTDTQGIFGKLHRKKIKS